MSKHTPGPWTSYPCNLEAYSRVITAKGAMVQIAHTGVRGKIAMTKEVYGDRMTYEPGEETTANARLIVAAPDLLAALERIAGFTLSQFMGPNDMALECVTVAREAIAKTRSAA